VLEMTANDSKLVFILGTSHTLQKGLADAPEGTYGEFQEVIRQAVQRHSVRTIGEEMSLMALGKTVSLPQKVAAELCVSHVFCDPDEVERPLLGIPIADCPATWSGRESEWLNRLQSVAFPVLFVCGANHVDSFCEKCEAQGMPTKVIEEDWTRIQPIPRAYLPL
jgi:hypothetical protein